MSNFWSGHIEGLTNSTCALSSITLGSGEWVPVLLVFSKLAKLFASND